MVEQYGDLWMMTKKHLDGSGSGLIKTNPGFAWRDWQKPPKSDSQWPGQTDGVLPSFLQPAT